MKNYLLKIQKINIPDHILNFRKNNPFAAIILSITLIFILLLYFSLPSFYNYENFDKEIQKKVSKDFKIDLKNISGVTYLILPSPHFLIEECDMYFTQDSKEKILKAKYLKINVFLKNLHKKEKIELKEIRIKNADVDLKFLDIKNFYSHLKYNISKPIYLSNSNFFFKNEEKEILSISKIKKFEYFFDLQNKVKKLNIFGNLFGSEFIFKWEKSFSNPFVTISDIKFRNPNLKISNKFNRKDENFIQAKTNINFLKNNLNLNYKFNKDSIDLIDDGSNIINNSKLIGNIDLNPFFFNLNLILSGMSTKTFLNNLFSNLHQVNNTSHLNFNGNLKINLNEINNRLFENLVINLNFLEKKISLKNSSLDLKKIGKINFSNPLIYEKNQKIFAKSKVKFDVNDQQEFYRRFLIPRQNRIDLNKVYFEIEYNIDDGSYFLSNINLDQSKINESVFYEIKNIQQLNNLISKEFKKVSLD
tara:strand:- start:638 stop:2062 length:1425 start_codon:yes stop_codon:yes gene_type:complete